MMHRINNRPLQHRIRGLFLQWRPSFRLLLRPGLYRHSITALQTE
jgi:hypothetical protein